MESSSKINDTFNMDEFHKQEAENAPYVRMLAVSILILCLIIAGILIYCLRHYQKIFVKTRARVAEGGLDFVATCLVPILEFLWMVIGWVMEMAFWIGACFAKGVKKLSEACSRPT